MGVLVIAGAAVRILGITHPLMWHGDRMVFALMARHIAAGTEFPLYLWLCHYGGALSSYVGALFFKAFGASYLTYGLVGIFFSCLWVFFSFRIARRLFDNGVGLYASMLLILVPPFNVLFFSLFAAMHAEILAFGSLLVLLMVRWDHEGSGKRRGLYPLLGFFSGVGLWISPALAPFLLTAITVFLINDRKEFFRKGLIFFVGGFLIGYLPALIYNIQYPGASLFRMAGRLLDLDRSVLSSPDMNRIIAEKVIWRISTIPISALRAPHLLSSLIGTLNAALFFIGLIWVLKKEYTAGIKNNRIGPFGILALYIMWFFVFYSVLVGVDRSRYMLPLYVVAPFFIGALLADAGKRQKAVPAVLLAAIALFNLSDIGYSFSEKTGPDYARLMRWLEKNNVRYGYSDYDTAYCVTFASNEKILVSPTVFDDKAFSERYPAYTKKVRETGSAVYIIQTGRFPEYVPMIHKRLKELGVRFKKDIVDGFIVYHGLSRNVYPEELGMPIPSPR